MADLSGRILGDYILREKIGDGGYGDVYRADHRLLKRVAVVKVLNGERQCSHDAKVRFLLEAQLASQLRHPYAAHVYDFGITDEDGLHWIAMEFVDGVTLGAWLKQRGPMGLPEFVPFFEYVAEVVHAAHAAGIIHRDLKPSNVMVTERHGLLVPKLLDFGIAKGRVAPLAEDEEPVDASGGDKVVTALVQATARITRTGSAVGSRPYMSPEQWGNASGVGPAADIYSLGIIIYEALTGRLPFPAESTDDYFRYHCQAPVPTLGGGFSPDLDRILYRALAKIPGDRHGNVLELAADLRAVLQADPHEQIRSWTRRWHERGRSPDLLARGQVLKDIERYVHRVGEAALSDLECSFVVHSQRLARRIRWFLRSLVALATVVAVGVAAMQLHSARQLAEVAVTQAELEQGRSALLHGEPEAPLHLGRAYQHGDHSPSTMFMLARALQPRLAEEARLASSSGRMWSAAFSPDGRRIVTADDRAAQVWDAQTGKLLFALPCGDTVYEAVYSVDGTKLVTAGGVGIVKIWDAASGALVRELRQDDTRPRYYAVAMSPDGRLVAAIDTRGDVAHVWDATTGEPIAEIRNDASEFPAIAFSGDGRWLATTGGEDVRVFDAQTRREAVTIRGPRIRSLAFDPTGPRLLTGAATGDVAIWSVPSGAKMQHLRDIRDPVDAVAFSPDGRLTAAGSRDGAVQIWRARSGELQGQLSPRHSKISAIEFDRASRLVLAASVDGAIIVADASLGGVPVSVLEGPQDVVVAHFDPSSRRVVGASLDGTAWVWDATSPYHRWSSPPVSDNCGIVTGPEPDRRFVAVGCMNRATQVWDTARDQLLAELPSVTPVVGDFTSAYPAVSGAGNRAAIARGNTVEIYELPGGRLLRTIVHGAAVNAVAFGETGRDVVSGAIDGSLLVTRDGGAQLALPISRGGIDAAGLLPDGRVITADAQRRLRVHDRGGAVLADLEIPTRVMSLRVDGAHLVMIPIAPPITPNVAPPLLVDLEHYRVVAQLEGHVGRVFSARWVAGSQILTAGTDGTARLWDGLTGQLRQVYRARSRIFTDAIVSDGLVIAGGADGFLQFWDRGSGSLLWMLHAHAAAIVGVQVEGGDIVTRGFNGELARWTLPNPGQVIGACGDHEHCAIVLR